MSSSWKSEDNSMAHHYHQQQQPQQLPKQQTAILATAATENSPYHQLILGTIHCLPHVKLSNHISVRRSLFHGCQRAVVVISRYFTASSTIGWWFRWQVRLQIHELSQELYRSYQMTQRMLWITFSQKHPSVPLLLMASITQSNNISLHTYFSVITKAVSLGLGTSPNLTY